MKLNNFLMSYLLPFLFNIVNVLLVTLIIASLTLIERKLLSLTQRRVGPYYVGYKGRLQYIADALKMFIKGIFIPNEVNKILFVLLPSLLIAICYSLYINVLWGPNLSMIAVEYNIIYALLLSTLFGMCVILTGFFSKNKYAVLASIRASILTLNLELLMGLFLLNICLISENFNINFFVIYQEIYSLFFLFFFIFGLIIILFLLEVNRAPFDLSEAESEIVSGYHVEYGGFFFALYYLGEYLHLFFFSSFLVICLFGGWELNINFIDMLYNF
jgi:NADH-quinone oxidoreductase subunit H